MPRVNHLSHEEYVSQLRRRIVETAEQVLNNSICVTEGSRQLVPLWYLAELPNDDSFNLFRMIESETELFPLGTLRQQWNTDALAVLDSQREEYEKGVRAQALRSCQALIDTYKTAS